MTQLIDSFGRVHDYLRISLLERCNLRCTYCMPEEGIQLRDKAEFMSQEELVFIAKKFVDLGVKKIRLTGGEPLLKKNFGAIVAELAQLPVELTMTTNGVLLDNYFLILKNAGLIKLNISLDSLQEERFNAISRRKDFQRIWKNINIAVNEGFEVKLNIVLMKGINEDEIIDFINLSKTRAIDIRFIEFMPFNGNEWDWTKKVSFKSIMERVHQHFGVDSVKTEPLQPNSTSKNYRISGYYGNFGIISSVTNPFCDTCNRIRLTADGKIKNCLFSSDETNLLQALRSGQDLDNLIKKSIRSKKESRAGIDSFKSKKNKALLDQNRSMTTIGG